MAALEYSIIPERARKAIEHSMPDEPAVAERVEHFSHTHPRLGDKAGDTEVLEGVTFTHHFIRTPGDYDFIEWHYVTAGSPDKRAIVFLHGSPDS